MTTNNTSETVTFREALGLLDDLKKGIETKFDKIADAHALYTGIIEVIAAQTLTTCPSKVRDILTIIKCNRE